MENRHSSCVESNSVVSIRYIMKNSQGEVLEDTMNNDPVSYLHGAATILPLLQVQLEGLKQGDRKTVCLTAAEGLTSEDFTFEVIIDQVRKASPEEMLLGYPVSATAEKCEADCNCYRQ